VANQNWGPVGGHLANIHTSPKRERGTKPIPSLALFDVALFPSPRRGRNIPAWGNAPGIEPRRRILSPERAKQHTEFADVVRHLSCPFRARNPPISGTRGGAALCPGLICFGPFRAEKPRALHFVGPNCATSKPTLRASVTIRHSPGILLTVPQSRELGADQPTVGARAPVRPPLRRVAENNPRLNPSISARIPRQPCWACAGECVRADVPRPV
jgi:hypothetical protein